MVTTRDLPESLAEVDLGVIDALKQLKQEADVLRERLSGLEAVKADFDPAVFSRVSADYSRQLDSIEAKAEQQRALLREAVIGTGHLFDKRPIAVEVAVYLHIGQIAGELREIQLGFDFQPDDFGAARVGGG